MPAGYQGGLHRTGMSLGLAKSAAELLSVPAIPVSRRFVPAKLVNKHRLLENQRRGNERPGVSWGKPVRNHPRQFSPRPTVGMAGTLVSVTPTRDGIVMAADSRSTLGGHYCDCTYKLVEVNHPNATAVAVAGIGIVFPRPPAGVADICQWVKTAPRVMDIEAFAKGYIESNPDDISESGLLRLGAASLEQVRQLQRFSPDASEVYAGNNFYTIAFASYEPQGSLAKVGAVGVRFNPATGQPELTDYAFWVFSPGDPGDVINFGLFEHVLQWGRPYMDSYRRFMPNKRTVAQIPSEDAVNALSNLMAAAAKATMIAPTPGGVGIGGPTDVLLLSRNARPVRLQWKAC